MTTLWTRQDIRSLDILKRENVFRNKGKYIKEQYGDIAPHFMEKYGWFVKEANKFVPVPEGVEFPIWCSISYENMLRPIENTVCYELEVPEEQIIYFDGGKWDYVLNHIYIPKDEADLKKYKEEMAAKGFENTFSFVKGKYSYFEEEKKRVIDSWNRIFDIDNWNIFTVQANIWEIKMDMVKNIMYYDNELPKI